MRRFNIPADGREREQERERRRDVDSERRRECERKGEERGNE